MLLFTFAASDLSLIYRKANSSLPSSCCLPLPLPLADRGLPLGTDLPLPLALPLPRLTGESPLVVEVYK